MFEVAGEVKRGRSTAQHIAERAFAVVRASVIFTTHVRAKLRLGGVWLGLARQHSAAATPRTS
jgi:hypothetical protein